jgi:hypothetical protein
MNKVQQFFLVFLLIPSYGEIINAADFSVNIPGSPFSLGRLTFILTGIIGIMANRQFFFRSNTFKGLLLIFIGSIFGGLLSTQVALSLSRSIGTIVLFMGSVGVATLFNLDLVKKSISIFFIVNFAFWTNYVLSHTMAGGLNFNSYSQLFVEKEVVNHHLVGVNISVSTIFIALKYFYKENQLRVLGYIVIFVGIFACFLSETRSNLLFLSLTLIIIVYFSSIKFTSLLLIIGPIMVGIVLFFTLVAQENEALFQRFDATDEEYQERTTGMRVDFIESFFTAFFVNPFGRGVFGTEISYGGMESTMLHNQYLTFILSGGIVALIGVYLWLKEFAKIFYKYVKQKLTWNIENYAYVFSMLTFILTLFTIEYSGLLFFLYISLLIFLSEDDFSTMVVSIINKRNYES